MLATAGKLSSMEKPTIQKNALAVDPKDRADLVDVLLESLDSESAKSIEQAWAEEAEDRSKAYQTGEVEALEGPVVISELKARYRR